MDDVTAWAVDVVTEQSVTSTKKTKTISPAYLAVTLVSGMLLALNSEILSWMNQVISIYL